MKNVAWFILSLGGLWFATEALALERLPFEAQVAELADEALRHNPELQAAKERWELYAHQVVAARSLSDPMLGFSFSNYPIDTFQADQTPMTGNEFRISQDFPFPGKLAAKGEVAQQQALWYQSVYEDAKLQLVQKVKEAYSRLYFQVQAIAVTEENLGILENFISLTKTRYEVGTGLQQDLLKAQVEQSKLLDKLLTFRQQYTSALAGLNRLLARPIRQPLALVGELEIKPLAADLDGLQQLARQNRPMFASFKSLFDRFDSQRKLAKLDYYPNFNVWASYRFRDDNLPDKGTDFVSAGFGINLPIWREKRSEAVAGAGSGRRMAQRQLAEFNNQVDFVLQDAYAQMEKNRDLAQLFATGIIPQSQQAFDASLMAYQVGKVEFLSLLDSLMNLYRYQLDYQRTLADYLRSVAQLEAAAGMNLTDPGSLQDQPTDRMKP